MSLERITVVADGRVYDRWESLAVIKEYIGGQQSFELRATELFMSPFDRTPFQEWNFPPCTQIDILATGSPLLTGARVYEYRPEGDALRHSVQVVGYAPAIEFALSSATNETGTFEDKTPIDIVKELAKPLNLEVEMDGEPGAPVRQFQIRKGSTPYYEAMRILPQRALFLTSSEDGQNIVVSDGKSINGKRHSGGVYQGRNILRMTGEITMNHRFSKHIMEGQARDGVDNDQDLEGYGESDDAGVCFTRPFLQVDPTESNPQRLKKHAEWHKVRSIGASLQATIVVRGFRDDGGQPWKPGHLAFVHAPWLKLEQDMAISRVEFRQNSIEGTVSELLLVDPRTIGGSAVDASGSGDIWGW